MRNRLLTAVIAATCLLPATAGVAQDNERPPTVCPFVEAIGEVRSAEFDIACAAVTFGRKQVVAVLTLRSAQDSGPVSEASAGGEWHILFMVGQGTHNFSRYRPPGPTPTYQYFFNSRTVTDVRETATEIRWTVPLSWAAGAKAGKRPDSFIGTAQGVVSQDAAGPPRKKNRS